MSFRRLWVYHMRRSGGHIVCYWLLRQAYPDLDVPLRGGFSKRKLYINGGATQPDRMRDPPTGTTLQVANGEHTRAIQARPGAVLVVRTPWNWLGSELSHHSDKRRMGLLDVDTWCHHAELALSPPKWLTPVIFDRFVENPEYRKSLAVMLDLPFCDLGLDHVPDYAGGSSVRRLRDEGDTVTLRKDVLCRCKSKRAEVAALLRQHPLAVLLGEALGYTYPLKDDAANVQEG